MAADDEKTPEPDPWADIVADGLDVGGEEISFEVEADERPAVESPATPAEAAEASSADGALDDEAAQAWLDESDAAPTAAADEPPSSFDPNGSFVVGGNSMLEGGSGLAGIWSLEPNAPIDTDLSADDPLAAVESESTEPDPWGEFGPSSGGEAGEASAESTADMGDDAGEVPFVAAEGAEDAAVAPVAVPPPAAPRGAKPAPRKQSGGIGQMIGVVAGGALAIPITLAILIWGLQRDPFGIAKMVPEQAAFLLPQKFRPGFKKSKGAPGRSTASAGSPLDAVATTGDAPGAEPPSADAAPETSAAVGDPPAEDLPMPDLADLSTDAATEVASAAAEPAGEASGVDASPNELSSDATPGIDAGIDVDGGSPAAPGLDDLAALTPPSGLDDLPTEPVAPAEPPPLDTAELDAALAEAAALGEALAAVEDRATRPAKLLLAQWYQAVARVAERLANLERTAADSGRPLTETPEQVAAFHATLVGRDPQAGDLARVAWDWLAYGKRQGDGVVLPVTFESARRVGPYWSASATLEKGDGARRSLSIVSRSEPSAVAGDRLLVTGLVLGDGVIWAADWRSTETAAATPATEPAVDRPGASDPLAAPELGIEGVEPATGLDADPAAEPAPF